MMEKATALSRTTDAPKGREGNHGSKRFLFLFD
jgi:hypothetical protein